MIQNGSAEQHEQIQQQQLSNQPSYDTSIATLHSDLHSQQSSSNSETSLNPSSTDTDFHHLRELQREHYAGNAVVFGAMADMVSGRPVDYTPCSALLDERIERLSHLSTPHDDFKRAELASLRANRAMLKAAEEARATANQLAAITKRLNHFGTLLTTISLRASNDTNLRTILPALQRTTAEEALATVYEKRRGASIPASGTKDREWGRLVNRASKVEGKLIDTLNMFSAQSNAVRGRYWDMPEDLMRKMDELEADSARKRQLLLKDIEQELDRIAARYDSDHDEPASVYESSTRSIVHSLRTQLRLIKGQYGVEKACKLPAARIRKESASGSDMETEREMSPSEISKLVKTLSIDDNLKIKGGATRGTQYDEEEMQPMKPETSELPKSCPLPLIPPANDEAETSLSPQQSDERPNSIDTPLLEPLLEPQLPPQALDVPTEKDSPAQSVQTQTKEYPPPPTEQSLHYQDPPPPPPANRKKRPNNRKTKARSPSVSSQKINTEPSTPELPRKSNGEVPPITPMQNNEIPKNGKKDRSRSVQRDRSVNGIGMAAAAAGVGIGIGMGVGLGSNRLRRDRDDSTPIDQQRPTAQKPSMPQRASSVPPPRARASAPQRSSTPYSRYGARFPPQQREYPYPDGNIDPFTGGRPSQQQQPKFYPGAYPNMYNGINANGGPTPTSHPFQSQRPQSHPSSAWRGRPNANPTSPFYHHQSQSSPTSNDIAPGGGGYPPYPPFVPGQSPSRPANGQRHSYPFSSSAAASGPMPLNGGYPSPTHPSQTRPYANHQPRSPYSSQQPLQQPFYPPHHRMSAQANEEARYSFPRGQMYSPTAAGARPTHPNMYRNPPPGIARMDMAAAMQKTHIFPNSSDPCLGLGLPGDPLGTFPGMPGGR